MDEPNLPSVVSDAFAASVAYEAPSLTVRMTGNWDMSAVELFDGFVRAFEVSAVREGATEVVIDITGIEFITSSCLKSLVRWIASLRRLSPPPPYSVRFRTSGKLPWQRRSLEPLLDLSEGRVSIES